MFKKLFGKGNGRRHPTQDQHAAGDTGNSLTLDKPDLMKSAWRKLEQNETGTKHLYRRKTGKKPPTEDQNAAEDTGNNRPPGTLPQVQLELLVDCAIQKPCVNETNISNIRILLLGSVGAGKSSFLNTVASIDKGRISQITLAGGADGSLTFALKEYRPQYKLKNFRILYTMGVEDNDQGGLNLNDVLYLVKGHIAADYKFNPATPIDERSPEFRPEPKDNEKIHCVVFVLDATVAGNDNISDARRRKIKALQTVLKAINLPRIVLLTKIDVLCEFVDEDIEDTYKSEKVKEAVNVAKELYQVPENCVFPVKNYTSEVEADYKKEILHLLALRQMIIFGTDFLDSVSASDHEEC